MTITVAKLQANKIIDNGRQEYWHGPVCPAIAEAINRQVHCDDPFCSTKRCAFRDHPRGRARWLAMDLDLENWSA